MNEYWKECPFKESQRVCFDKVNPKKFGSAAWERFEIYKNAQTIGEYFEIIKSASWDKHFAKRDLQNDIKKGICQIKADEPAGAKGSGTSSTPIPPTSSHDECKAGAEDVKKAGVKDAPTSDSPAALHDASAFAEVGAPNKNHETSATAEPVSQDSVNGAGGTQPNKEEVPSGKSLASNDQEEKSHAKVGAQTQNTDVPQPTRLEDQSLFSLLGGQPKKQESKKAARQEKEQKEAKAPKETKKSEKSEAKPSRTSDPPPKRESAQRKQKNTPKAVKILQVREFVRDMVVDYIEGQPDPPEKPLTTTDGKLISPMKRDKDSKEPIVQQHRRGFVWVVDTGNSAYTHDSKLAQPLPSTTKHLRCDVCGKSCKQERLFRVRCYSRRVPGVVPELKDPRVMRPETYLSGVRCLEVLLDPPYLQLSFIKRFRKRLLVALEAQGFDDRQWLEPLWRLDDAHGKAFRDLLSAELARVIRARGADEETEKEHNQKKLHEIDSFKDREHYRQLRLDKMVVTRCKTLNGRLSLSLLVNSRGKEEHKKASGNAVVPDVLEDFLFIATRNAVSLSHLGLRPVAPGPQTQDFGAASPVEGPPTKKAKLPQTTEPPNFLVPEPVLSSQPGSTIMMPNLAMPVAQVLPRGERQIWDGTDNFRTNCYEFCGFQRRMLNCTYFAEQASYVNGRRTFWDESKSVFMYWQSTSQRWVICQRWQYGQDLLKQVQSGRDLGWAVFKSPGCWSEFSEGGWQQVNVTTVIGQRDPPPSLMDQLATGPPNPQSISALPHVPGPPSKNGHQLTPLVGRGSDLDGADGIETIGVDTPPLVMAMPVEPCVEGADNDFLDICTPPA